MKKLLLLIALLGIGQFVSAMEEYKMRRDQEEEYRKSEEIEASFYDDESTYAEGQEVFVFDSSENFSDQSTVILEEKQVDEENVELDWEAEYVQWCEEQLNKKSDPYGLLDENDKKQEKLLTIGVVKDIFDDTEDDIASSVTSHVDEDSLQDFSRAYQQKTNLSKLQVRITKRAAEFAGFIAKKLEKRTQLAQKKARNAKINRGIRKDKRVLEKRNKGNVGASWSHGRNGGIKAPRKKLPIPPRKNPTKIKMGSRRSNETTHSNDVKKVPLRKNLPKAPRKGAYKSPSRRFKVGDRASIITNSSEKVVDDPVDIDKKCWDWVKLDECFDDWCETQKDTSGMTRSDKKIEKETIFDYIEAFQNSLDAKGITLILKAKYQSLSNACQVCFMDNAWKDHITNRAEAFFGYLNTEAKDGRIIFPQYNWNTMYEEWKSDLTLNDETDDSSIGSSSDDISNLDDIKRLKEATIEFLQKKLTDDYEWLKRRYRSMSSGYKAKNKYGKFSMYIMQEAQAVRNFIEKMAKIQ